MYGCYDNNKNHMIYLTNISFYAFTGTILVCWLVLWLIRLFLGHDITFLGLNTSDHRTWIYLHVIIYSTAGFIVRLDHQKYICTSFILFELCEYLGCKYGISYLNNTLDLPNNLIPIHDIIMNLAAQFVGLALSERLQLLLDNKN